MKKTFIVLIIYIFCGCTNHKLNDKTTTLVEEKVADTIPNKYFETILYDKKFEFIVDESYKGSNAVSCFGIGYHLLIGSTQNAELPKKLSVLYHSSEPYELKKGDKVNIIPEKKQNFEDNGFGIIYVASDTIINGKTETHILGSENKSIWAERIEL